jgi:pentatricopeptide repeat protein
MNYCSNFLSLVAFSLTRNLVGLKIFNIYLSFSAFEHHIGMAITFQGLCEQTVSVLQLMEAEGIEPNLVMLNLLINAFSTAGRHLEALAVFQHIKDSVCTFS